MKEVAHFEGVKRSSRRRNVFRAVETFSAQTKRPSRRWNDLRSVETFFAQLKRFPRR
jgi:hypothetical protein